MGLVRRTALALLALLLTVALAGSALAANRFARHTVLGQGLSLAVPASWVVADSRLPDDVIERLSRENPQLEPFMRGLRGPNAQTKFIALDPAIRDRFATNVNVVVVPFQGAITFAQYRRALATELRAVLQGAKVEEAVVTIHGARALRVRYRLRLQLGRAFTVQALQYAFLRKGRSVVVTYTTLPQHAPRYEQVFATSAASIRFSRP